MDLSWQRKGGLPIVSYSASKFYKILAAQEVHACLQKPNMNKVERVVYHHRVLP